MSGSGITRREFLKHSAILGGAAMLAPSMLWAGERSGARPNVIFILTDDQLRGQFGCYGGKGGLTPNVDKLAGGGVKFTHACSTSPLCSPSRVSCITGRFAGRFRPYVSNGFHFPAVQPTAGSILKAAGYQTAFVGKLHAYIDGLTGVREVGKRLNRIGFTYAEKSHMTRFKKGDHLKHQEEDFDAAIKFVTANKDKPFALFLFTTLTHGPGEAPKKYLDMVKGAGGRAKVGKAMYLWLDDLVGKLVGTVDKLGIRERTAICFAGDHAPSFWGDVRGKLHPGDRCKGTLYDGWVPQVVSWPGHVKRGLAVGEVVQNIDFLPTFLDVCGVKPPAAARLDGMSFLPLMQGKRVKWREEAFFEMEPGRAVRTDRWKYMAIRPVKGMHAKFEKYLRPYGGERDLLFDLKKDPTEKKNLFKDPKYAATVRDMQARLRKLCAGYSYKYAEFGGGGS